MKISDQLLNNEFTAEIAKKLGEQYRAYDNTIYDVGSFWRKLSFYIAFPSAKAVAEIDRESNSAKVADREIGERLENLGLEVELVRSLWGD